MERRRFEEPVKWPVFRSRTIRCGGSRILCFYAICIAVHHRSRDFSPIRAPVIVQFHGSHRNDFMQTSLLYTNNQTYVVAFANTLLSQRLTTLCLESEFTSTSCRMTCLEAPMTLPVAKLYVCSCASHIRRKHILLLVERQVHAPLDVLLGKCIPTILALRWYHVNFLATLTNDRFLFSAGRVFPFFLVPCFQEILAIDRTPQTK